MPASPDCSISVGESGPLRHAAASSTSVTAAVVPSARTREVSTPPIKTGSTSSAAKLNETPTSSRCSKENAVTSTPMVDSHCRRRWFVPLTGSASAPRRGSSHSVMACVAYTIATSTAHSAWRWPLQAPMPCTATTLSPMAARAAT
jgi:hypothetical protein